MTLKVLSHRASTELLLDLITSHSLRGAARPASSARLQRDWIFDSENRRFNHVCVHVYVNTVGVEIKCVFFFISLWDNNGFWAYGSCETDGTYMVLGSILPRCRVRPSFLPENGWTHEPPAAPVRCLKKIIYAPTVSVTHWAVVIIIFSFI